MFTEGRLLAPPRVAPSRSAVAPLFLGGLRGRRLRPRGFEVCNAAARRPRAPVRPRPSRLATLMAMLARRVWLARGPGAAGRRLPLSGGPSPSPGGACVRACSAPLLGLWAPRLARAAAAPALIPRAPPALRAALSGARRARARRAPPWASGPFLCRGGLGGRRRWRAARAPWRLCRRPPAAVRSCRLSSLNPYGLSSLSPLGLSSRGRAAASAWASRRRADSTLASVLGVRGPGRAYTFRRAQHLPPPPLRFPDGAPILPWPRCTVTGVRVGHTLLGAHNISTPPQTTPLAFRPPPPTHPSEGGGAVPAAAGLGTG